MADAIEQWTFHESGAETATGQSRPFVAHQAEHGAFYLDVTAASGTTPTLDVTIEGYDEVSGKWFTITSFTQATGTTSERKAVTAFADLKIRAVWTIGGTGPSFTFTISGVGKA